MICNAIISINDDDGGARAHVDITEAVATWRHRFVEVYDPARPFTKTKWNTFWLPNFAPKFAPKELSFFRSSEVC